MKSKQPKKNKAGKSGGRMQATRVSEKARKEATRGPAKKLPEPKVCPECKATYRDGRWVWPAVANPTGTPVLCPACERIRERRPAGEVRITGEFAAAHRDEILARARHVEEREKREHPLQRIMAVAEQAGETVVTTTDPHLAHAIGTALHDAFKGELSAPYGEKGELARVRWTR